MVLRSRGADSVGDVELAKVGFKAGGQIRGLAVIRVFVGPGIARLLVVWLGAGAGDAGGRHVLPAARALHAMESEGHPAPVFLGGAVSLG